ncbi:MAG: hypothetical protein ACRDQX_01035 [Pseudonocardiaceae bacterium]
MRNSVPTPNATHERRLSAALRTQASWLGTGSPTGTGSPARTEPGRGPAHARPRLSASTVLVLAVLLGAMAGTLAGVISAW